MKNTKLLILIIFISLNTVFAQESIVNDNTPKAYEMPRTQVISIYNSATKAQSELYIKLPEGYVENSDIEYPVIYFTHPVQHIEILSALTENLIEDVIIVGIPWLKGMRFNDNKDLYVNFIRNDVFKTIENNYRADTGRRTYFGYSFGALVGAYILAEHPNTFKNFILGSPAFGSSSSATRKIFELESNTAKERKKLNVNVFVAYGTLEKEEDIKGFEKFITMLKNINDESLTLKHVVIEGGTHQTAFPMTAVLSVTWLSGLIKE
ncbi:MAG: alpha/beta hydrolase [Flavobacteriaceae bacterium]|nr:alpha/beta hydrolase [Flavobacteriaceae bacterium]